VPERLRVGVVGAGYFGRFHIEAWTRIPRAELVAVCDGAFERARQAASETGAKAFCDAHAMLDAGSLDLIDIATPPAPRLGLVELAAKRGLPIICQKPVAQTFREAETLVETAASAGVALIVHENFRFQPWFREAKRLVTAGALGKPHSIAFRLRPGDGQGPHAYLARQPYFQKAPRLLIHETAIHFIDTFRFLMGEITGVFARLRRINPALAGEDAGYMLFEFAGGSTGMFDGNRLNEHVAEDMRLTMGEMHLEGEAGVLRLDGSGRLFWKPHGEAERVHDYHWEKRGFAGDSVRKQQEHALAHLLDGAPLENNGRAYLRNLAIEEAVYRSDREGIWISTDPAVGD
jgi:D-apiose dehydrogenase